MDVIPLRYGCVMAEMHNVSQSTSQSNFIIPHLLSSEMVLNVSIDFEKTIWNRFECFQDGHQIALNINGTNKSYF